ncbi:MAG: alpha/beta fold hydrolase [Betaproteobacteria bacterium]|nr:alpha/beta fold hydrolase [Betaproteobacteria bacterium]
MSPDTMPPRDDDFDRGLRNRRAVLGEDWVRQSTSGAHGFNADFQNLITRYAWHEIWGRPGLDHTTRRLLVLGMTMGQARWEEFELHCRAALRGGVPWEKIQETLLQGAIYCGVPAANTAFKITTGILRDEGLLPGPAPLTPDVRVQFHHTFSQPQLRVALQGVARGLPVVFSHALGLDLHMWDDIAAAVARDHPVLRYDHRGHGGSGTGPGTVSIDDLVEDAARVIREWGRGPVAFVGLSMGGMVGQGLAIRHPDCLARLFLANTTSSYPPAAQQAWAARVQAVREGGMSAVADMVVERYVHAPFRATHPDVVRQLRATLLRQDAGAYADACEAVAGVNWTDQLHRVTCPTQVLAGALDVGAPPEMGRALAERIPGAALTVLPGASHLSVAECPAEFLDVVRGWLRGPVA